MDFGGFYTEPYNLLGTQDMNVILPILFVVALIALVYYDVVTKPKAEERKREAARKVCSHTYHLKESLLTLIYLRKHSREIQASAPHISAADLQHLQEALLAKSAALAATSALLAQAEVDKFGKPVFGTNVALQREDRAMIRAALEDLFGDRAQQYDVDLDDERYENIMRLLREFSLTSR